MFDAKFYLAQYPDVRAAGVDPWLHYLQHGAAEHRKPHPLFDPAYYLTQCPEAAGEPDLLLHFLQSAPAHCANPHPLFDCEGYLRANPSAVAQRANPLMHHVKFGRGASAAAEGGYFGVT